ncbi:MAG: hypothetical protein QM572_05900 [Nocardioides sp.]|uniref:hypothetical protein n=1 Tax=Nocardioides sp. TaxID=35761 RepID=UPI0039E4AEB0
MDSTAVATLALFAVALFMLGAAVGALAVRRRWAGFDRARSARAMRDLVNAAPPSIPVTDAMGRYAPLVVEYETAVNKAAIFALQPGPNAADRTEQVMRDQAEIRRLRAQVLDLLNSRPD